MTLIDGFAQIYMPDGNCNPIHNVRIVSNLKVADGANPVFLRVFPMNTWPLIPLVSYVPKFTNSYLPKPLRLCLRLIIYKPCTIPSSTNEFGLTMPIILLFSMTGALTRL